MYILRNFKVSANIYLYKASNFEKQMYTLLLLVVLVIIMLTSGAIEILKMVAVFALAFYLGKHYSHYLDTSPQADSLMARANSLMKD